MLGDLNLHDIIWTPDENNQCVFLPHAIVNATTSQRRSQYNEAALNFLHQMMELPLFQLSSDHNNAENVLDLLFVNSPDDVVISRDQFTIIERAQQDEHHISIEIAIDCSGEQMVNIEEKTIYRYASGNYERMSQQLEAINFQHEFNTRDVDSAYDFFLNSINSLIELNVPKTRIKLYSNKPKWWSPELQRLKNRRDKLYKRKTKGMMTDEYLAVLQEFNDLCERRHKSYILRIQENVKSNPKKFWNLAKINGGSTTYPRVMHLIERKSQSLAGAVNHFAEYFESIYIQDDQPWEFNDIYRTQPNVIDINITLFDIESAIHSIKWKSSAGPDELSPFVITNCESAVVWPIWLLFQKIA